MVFPLLLALLAPADWIPARWPWIDAASLDLLKEVPVNCLLLEWKPDGDHAAFARAARERALVTLGVLAPGPDLAESARLAAKVHPAGLVLEGDFAADLAEAVRRETGVLVIEMTPRYRMPLGRGHPVVATYQGVWPWWQTETGGVHKAGPTGGVWIDTNSGFLQAARGWGDSVLWIGNRPPSGNVIAGARYLQAIADAALVGARWVLALDDGFAHALRAGDGAARADWQRAGRLLRFLEQQAEWRRLQPAGQLAIVQDPEAGALLSGGIVDMIQVKHTPVRPVPRSRLREEALAGVKMAVNVDATGMTDAERAVLRAFTRGGGTLLTGPPGWKSEGVHRPDRITLDKDEIDRLDQMWREVNQLIGRRNLGARLFNVSSMLSNLLSSPDGKQTVIHLVNYSGYPVESVTIHLPGDYRRARLLAPDSGEQDLEVYKTDEGTGVDVPQVGVWATVSLE